MLTKKQWCFIGELNWPETWVWLFIVYIYLSYVLSRVTQQCLVESHSHALMCLNIVIHLHCINTSSGLNPWNIF